MKHIVFLSTEEVCLIQKSTLPGAPSSNPGLIEGAVNRIINEYLYNNNDDIFYLAALYLIAIAKAHAFPDANKRTAYQANLMFLELNDISISENISLVEMTVKAAEGSITVLEIIEILKKYSK